MKIVDVEAFVLANQEDVTGPDPTHQAVIVRVTTDSGISGYGESSSSPHLVKAAIEAPSFFAISRSMKEIVVGRDPFDHAYIWEDVYRLTSYPGKRGVVIHALSALDIALWDIMGKAIGLPIHKLLGGAFRKRIPAYCSLVMPFDEDGVRSVVGAARAEGWHAIKLGWFPPRSTPAHDRALVAAAREGAGADVRLMLDVGPRWDLAGNDRPAVQLWDVKTAIRAIDDWAEYDPFWIEEPLPSDDVDGYRRLCEAVRPYIAAGEQEATRFPLFDLMDRGCIDIVQFDVSRVGGITEARRVVQAAQDRNRPFAPHCYSTGISLAATAHLLAASATPMYLEFTTSDSPLLRDLCSPALDVVDGEVCVPERPGLGIDIDEDMLVAIGT